MTTTTSSGWGWHTHADYGYPYLNRDAEPASGGSLSHSHWLAQGDYKGRYHTHDLVKTADGRLVRDDTPVYAATIPRR